MHSKYAVYYEANLVSRTVVSTIVSAILFACFPTVEHINKG